MCPFNNGVILYSFTLIVHQMLPLVDLETMSTMLEFLTPML